MKKKGWSNTQKQIFARACSAIGFSEDQRHMILSSLPNAYCPKKGHHSSTSKKLTDRDFEQVMAVIEKSSGGAVKLSKQATGANHYRPGYWSHKASDPGQRLRWKALAINDALEAQLENWKKHGEGLRGWIHNRVTHGRTDDITKLTPIELHNLVNGLSNFAKDKRVVLRRAPQKRVVR